MTIFPKAMCTQHPDSASRYISTQDEVSEAIECFSMGCDEYMPDYEGKTTPYHQNVQIVAKLLEETELVPSVDINITPRVPNASHENRFRQLMVLMSIAEANALSGELKAVQAINEFVHPMTSGSEELFEAQKHAVDITNLASKEFNLHIETPVIIPLIESVESLLKAEEIIRKIPSCFNKLDIKKERFRVFIGKSDASLFSGHTAGALACKYAIQELRELEKEIPHRIGIILGAGALPFRGHVTSSNAENLFSEYRGIDTITIQSALRYDHRDAEKFIKAIVLRQPEYRSEDEKKEILQIIRIMEEEYRKAIPAMAGVINTIAGLLPNQRDRLISSGIAGYARKTENELKLPRAIKFTGALYSIGMPPEFIGTGRGLARIKKDLGQSAYERLLECYYPSLETDLVFASRFLDIENAKDFLPDDTFELIKEDVVHLHNTFDLKDNIEHEYRILMNMVKPHLRYTIKTGSKTCGESAQMACSALLKMAIMRKSLG